MEKQINANGKITGEIALTVSDNRNCSKICGIWYPYSNCFGQWSAQQHPILNYYCCFFLWCKQCVKKNIACFSLSFYAFFSLSLSPPKTKNTNFPTASFVFSQSPPPLFVFLFASLKRKNKPHLICAHSGFKRSSSMGASHSACIAI